MGDARVIYLIYPVVLYKIAVASTDFNCITVTYGIVRLIAYKNRTAYPVEDTVCNGKVRTDDILYSVCSRVHNVEVIYGKMASSASDGVHSRTDLHRVVYLTGVVGSIYVKDVCFKVAVCGVF